VLEYIDEHLDGELPLERLSGVAAFSKYHFHRQFSELFGIGVYKYVQLVRFRRASYQLAFRDHERIIDIALAGGYESHEAFARAFKKALGQTPSEFREQPAWDPWHATYQPLTEVRTQYMKPNYRAEDVQIVQFDETPVATLQHRGHPNALENTIRKFIEWRKQNNLPPRLSATFNILYDDPIDTPPEQFRLDICAATDRGVAENSYGVVEQRIPSGRCARLRHTGSEAAFVEAIKFLYSSWLAGSGEELRDFPLFVQRVRFFPDVPEHEAVTDIFLPLR
jgi:AraC family transcriptional regulator